MAVDSSTLVCPGCHRPTDPAKGQCEHCRYLHLGWLVGTEEERSESRQSPNGLVDRLAAFLDHREEGIGGILVAVVSLLVLCGGLLLHNHYQPLKAQCDSAAGSLAQEVSGSALRHCSTNGFLADIGLVITLFSGFMVVVGIVAFFVARQRPHTEIDD